MQGTTPKLVRALIVWPVAFATLLLLDFSLLKAFAQSADDRRVRELTIDDLKFDIEPDEDFDRSMLTKELLELEGKRIRLRGYIRPSFQQSGITRFVFVRDNQECCFGPGAALYDCVLVEMAEGKSTNFTVRPITVQGEFYLEEFTGPDGRIWAIFRMRAAEVMAR